MKTVELRSKCEVSDFPIQSFKELNKYDEYFLVAKSTKSIFVLRYIEEIKKWYLIALDGVFSRELNVQISDLCEDFYIFCIPEYTGGCNGISENEKESNKARKDLFRFLIDKFMD